MSGRSKRAHFGQLALLDAVVFFVIAIAVSSMMFYYANGEAVSRAPAAPEGQFDPDAVFRVFLHASLGEEIILELDGGTRISASSEIAECIQIELGALVLGADVGHFEALNERLLMILKATCSTLLTPYLLVTWFHEEGNEILLVLPGAPPHSHTRYASSVELPGMNGSAFLLTLILVPASFSEVLDIGAGNLDLGSGVG